MAGFQLLSIDYGEYMLLPSRSASQYPRRKWSTSVTFRVRNALQTRAARVVHSSSRPRRGKDRSVSGRPVRDFRVAVGLGFSKVYDDHPFRFPTRLPCSPSTPIHDHADMQTSRVRKRVRAACERCRKQKLKVSMHLLTTAMFATLTKKTVRPGKAVCYVPAGAEDLYAEYIVGQLRRRNSPCSTY